jgi:hypothetical protein
MKSFFLKKHFFKKKKYIFFLKKKYIFLEKLKMTEFLLQKILYPHLP